MKYLAILPLLFVSGCAAMALVGCADLSYGGFHSRTLFKDPKVKIVRIKLADGTEIYLEGAESPVSEAFKSGVEAGKNLRTVLP